MSLDLGDIEINEICVPFIHVLRGVTGESWLFGNGFMECVMDAQ